MSTVNTTAPWSYERTAQAVLNHALANYDKGWDVIVECLSVAEIVNELRPRKIWSEGGAIKYFAQQVKIHQEAALSTV